MGRLIRLVLMAAVDGSPYRTKFPLGNNSVLFGRNVIGYSRSGILEM
jgi:hypothetical protein